MPIGATVVYMSLVSNRLSLGLAYGILHRRKRISTTVNLTRNLPEELTGSRIKPAAILLNGQSIKLLSTPISVSTEQ